MTHQTEETFVPLADMPAFEMFYADNKDGLDDIGDRETCLRLAMNCSLVVGGGAAPLFRIGFVG